MPFVITDTDLERARLWGTKLENRESDRTGRALDEVRPRMAGRIGINPGTLEALRNGRLKTISTRVFRRLQAAIIKDLRSEIERCEHELALALEAGLDPRSPQVAAVELHLAAAREALTSTHPDQPNSNGASWGK